MAGLRWKHFDARAFRMVCMTNGFIELLDIESLDRFLAQSNGDPVIIFKHSDACDISARAYAQMSELERPVGLVTVQKARALSDEIEKRMGVVHETPQVLIVHDGQVAWTASHGRVKAEAVEAALEVVGSKQTGH
ncbi:MAG TPA: bacillithiol system redox-active protein YtxJ [Pyrinomonadaceae bacterium]|nr:bacillithiol system redox-active protein YtxJ [Pyrinomonadaceae bacterium]